MSLSYFNCCLFILFRAKYHDLNDRRKTVRTKLPEKSEVFAEYNKYVIIY